MQRKVITIFDMEKNLSHYIRREYDISHSLFDKWVKQAENSGSFHEKDNRTPQQEELIRLRKENQQLKMENDILKQAALILGRK